LRISAGLSEWLSLKNTYALAKLPVQPRIFTVNFTLRISVEPISEQISVSISVSRGYASAKFTYVAIRGCTDYSKRIPAILRASDKRISARSVRSGAVSVQPYGNGRFARVDGKHGRQPEKVHANVLLAQFGSKVVVFKAKLSKIYFERF